MRSEDQASALLPALALAQQRRPRRVLEDLAHALAGLGRALEVVLGTDLLCNGHALLNVVVASRRMEGRRDPRGMRIRPRQD